MIIEQTKSVFQFDARVITPLMQIEPNGNEKDRTTMASIIRTKKHHVYENGKVEKLPFFSANGFRGLLRRQTAADIFQTLESRDGIKMDVDTLHLYASGGTTSNRGLENLNYAQQEKLREENPFISLYGAGLSDIDGKLAVSDLVPTSGTSKNVLDYLFAVRFDDTQRSSTLSPLISEKSVGEYLEKMHKRRGGNAKIRKLETQIEGLQGKERTPEEEEELLDLEAKLQEIVDEKEMSYQQIYKAEFIIPGTELSGCLSTRGGHTLTRLETATLLYGLIKTASIQIGSNTRVGWGVLDYHVMDGEGNTLFKTLTDSNYVFNKTFEISEQCKMMLEPYFQWLETLERKTIVRR